LDAHFISIRQVSLTQLRCGTARGALLYGPPLLLPLLPPPLLCVGTVVNLVIEINYYY